MSEMQSQSRLEVLSTISGSGKTPLLAKDLKLCIELNASGWFCCCEQKRHRSF